MSVVYITETANRAGPATGPVLRAQYIFQRAMAHEEASHAFDREAFGAVVEENGRDFDRIARRVKTAPSHMTKGWAETVAAETLTIPKVKNVVGIIDGWSQHWCGPSERFRWLAFIEAMLRYLGLDERKFMRLPGAMKTVPWQWAALLNPDRPRIERAVRSAAYDDVTDPEGLAFKPKHELVLARFADLYFRHRVLREPLPVQDVAKRQRLRDLEPWDAAAEYTRGKGRPRRADYPLD